MVEGGKIVVRWALLVINRHALFLCGLCAVSSFVGKTDGVETNVF